MMGVEMMLKQMLGIDPEELKAQAAQLIAQGQDMAERLEQRITGIEMALQVVTRNQTQLCALLIQMRDGTAPVETPALEHEEKSDGNSVN